MIRLAVSDCRVMGRATQGVRLINLAKKNDVIASVCKVMTSEMEAALNEQSEEQEEKTLTQAGRPREMENEEKSE